MVSTLFVFISKHTCANYSRAVEFSERSLLFFAQFLVVLSFHSPGMPPKLLEGKSYRTLRKENEVLKCNKTNDTDL